MKIKFHLDNPLDGQKNMDIDEDFFHQLNTSSRYQQTKKNNLSNHEKINSVPKYFEDENVVIRIYEWKEPTLSLGISQDIDVLNSQLIKDNIKVVKRITGGRIVLHHQEITYAVIGQIGGFWGRTLHESYSKISNILKQFLLRLGLPVDGIGNTFQSISSIGNTLKNKKKKQRSLVCYDSFGFKEIAVEGKKMIGSSQKRGQYAFLQHGSIPYFRHNFRVEDYLLKPYQPSPAMKDQYTFISDYVSKPILIAKKLLQDTFYNAINQVASEEKTTPSSVHRI